MSELLDFGRWIYNALRRIKMSTVTSILSSVLFVALLSAASPFILRSFLLPQTVTRVEPLDFTFNTCDTQLGGVCSFPEAVLDLREHEFELSPGYRHAFSVVVHLYDSYENQNLGMFQIQLTAKDEDGKVLGVLKKTVLARRSWLSSSYYLVRNTFFFPLYIMGFLTSGDLVHNVRIPGELHELATRPTAQLVVQLQNRFIEVSYGELHIRASVGLWSWAFNEFPLASFLATFVFVFAALLSLDLTYWVYQGISELERTEGVAVVVERFLRILPTPVNRFLQSLLETPLMGPTPAPATAADPPAPPPTPPLPPAWNEDEQPESLPVDEYSDLYFPQNSTLINKPVQNGNTVRNRNGLL